MRVTSRPAAGSLLVGFQSLLSRDSHRPHQRKMILRQFIQLGGTRADLKYDIARGWVTVLDPR